MFIFTATIFLVVIGLLLSIYGLRRPGNGRQLPPGPRGFPIIGNLHILGNLPHRTLHELAKRYGPIMFIRLGYVPTVVVSSPEAAELFLKTHDNIFSSRPTIQASKYLSYGNKGMSFTPYGPHWRSVRKFCILELLSTAKIESLAGMRRQELGILVEEIKAAAVAREVVNLSKKVAALVEDMTYKMLFGRSKNDRFDLNAIVQETFEVVGAFNIADLVPFLAPFDLQGLTRRIKAASKKVDGVLEIIIQEHEFQENEKGDKDFVDVMLSLEKSGKTDDDESSYTIDRNCMKAILLDMIAGAIDTSLTAILWALSELIRCPRVMKKLQDEIKNVIGVDRMVEEADLCKLEYLDMVVKENFRLHPVGPLLVPRESMEDIVINGYYIPKKSRIIINSWALGRDPKIWSDNVEEFLPERFMGTNIDVRGRDFQLLPFGSGRRICPGINLGLINVRLVVAQLVHCFNWELPNGISPNELDMSEIFGLSAPREKPLLAVPTYRLQTDLS